MPIPYAELRKLDGTSPLLALYTLDLTGIGGAVYRFTNTPNGSDGVVFGGQTYTPIPIQAEGWDFTSTGAPAQPTLTVSNVNRTLLADVIGLGDLVGGKITRVRVFAKHLDGQPTADPTRFIGPDVFIINQKTAHNRDFIQWQMATPIDRMGTLLPRQQILKDKGFPGVARTRVIG